MALGRPLAWLAERLRVAVSTLRGWVRSWRSERLPSRRRGRPRRVERAARRKALKLIRDHPSFGARRVARLAGIPRRVAADLKARLRARHEQEAVCACEWTTPGSVWAMDFTRPRVPQELGATRVLPVRDLASGCQLAARACRGESAEDVAAELERLFALHGPPLVVKGDNGSPLVAEVVLQVLEAHGVAFLRSPPYQPTYNGSCERALGWTKILAIECMRARGATKLAQADLDEARRLQNESGSPRHSTRASPRDAWEARLPPSDTARKDFRLALDRALEDEARAFEQRAGHAPRATDRATIERAATSRVLCELNYLRIRRR